MLASIGECFLDDSVGGHLEGGRQVFRLAFDRQSHGELCFAYLGDEVAKLGEAGLRGELVHVSSAP